MRPRDARGGPCADDRQRAVRFATRGGHPDVGRRDDLLELDLPAANADRSPRARAVPRRSGLPDSPAWLADGCNDAAIIEVADEAAVRAVAAGLRGARQDPPNGGRHRARRSTQDVVSRVFVPYLGIDEDPVTGSAHAALVPYWAERLGRRRVHRAPGERAHRRAALPARGRPRACSAATATP